MSGLVVLSFTLTAAFVDLLPGLFSSQPVLFSGEANGFAVLGLVLMLMLAASGLFAFFLYTYFGDAYFGQRAAQRWALFGALFGLLISLPLLFDPPQMLCLAPVWGVICLLAAFFAARRIIPLNKK